MKALVIQGGGSFGAYTVGRLVRTNKNYDVAVGSSTGALIAPFALLNDYNTLKHCYTTTDNKDVYSRVPFYGNGIPKPIMALVAFLRSKKGITDSKPLRDLIKQYYTEAHHAAIADTGKELFVTVCELNAKGNAAIYVQATQTSHEHMCDMIWASTCVPGLLEPLIEKTYVGNGEHKTIEYVDGGTVENCGLKKAIE